MNRGKVAAGGGGVRSGSSGRSGQALLGRVRGFEGLAGPAHADQPPLARHGVEPPRSGRFGSVVAVEQPQLRPPALGRRFVAVLGAIPPRFHVFIIPEGCDSYSTAPVTSPLVQWDGEERTKRTRERDRALRDYVRYELGTLSPHYRERFRAAGIDPRRLRGLDELRPLAATQWEALADDPEAFLLRPRESDLVRLGERKVVLSIVAGRLLGRRDRVNREVIEPRYQPSLWTLADGVPVAYTDHDLDLLGEAGARMLAVAGLDRRDLLVGLAGAGPDLGYWQTVLGARHAGVAALHLGPDADPIEVAAARPTALAGRSAALRRVLAGQEPGDLDELRVVLVVGEDPDAGARDDLEVAARNAVGPEADDPLVVAAWAPPGVRALWTECPEGPGYHTYPDLEILEVGRGGAIHRDGEGELLWTALGWRGTAVLRLRTRFVAEVTDEECDCGRTTPIVHTGSRWVSEPVRLLEAEEAVSSFQVELRQVNGSEELLVFMALKRGTELEELLEDLDPLVGATQYVVLAKRSVDAKVTKTGRVLDTR